MKSEYQWNQEIKQAFKEWKTEDPRAYDCFRHWNKYHLNKTNAVTHKKSNSPFRLQYKAGRCAVRGCGRNGFEWVEIKTANPDREHELMCFCSTHIDIYQKSVWNANKNPSDEDIEPELTYEFHPEDLGDGNYIKCKIQWDE